MDRMQKPGSAVSERRATSEPPPRPASFEAFFEAEHERLFRALYLVTGNAQEAEELMQDAFVAVWERWDRVSAMDEPTGYLFRTAMNRFRSRLRRASRAARRAAGSDPGGDAFAAADERDAVARRAPAIGDRPDRTARLRFRGGRPDPRREGRDRSVARLASASGLADPPGGP